MKIRWAQFAALATALSSPATAQDVVGTSVLGSKRVELLSDNTWRFSDIPQADGNCVPISAVLSFCGSILDWRPSRTAGTDFTRVFRHTDRIGAGIIHEEIGAADGMDLGFMRNIVIENAADATGTRPEEIPILSVSTGTVGNHPSETIVYGATLDGLDITYHNTIVSSDHHTFQLLVWNVGDPPGDTLPGIIASFTDAVRITLPDEANQ